MGNIYSIIIAKTSCLMLFKETIDVYCESYMHYIYTYMVSACSYGMCSYHCALSEELHEVNGNLTYQEIQRLLWHSTAYQHVHGSPSLSMP